MRVLVCGSRSWSDSDRIQKELNHVFDEFGVCDRTDPFTIIDGCARGADTLAYEIAVRCKWTTERYPADWKRHGHFAGPLRNREMLKEGKPDLVLAFWDGSSPGTAHMVRLARQAGVEVRVFSHALEGRDGK